MFYDLTEIYNENNPLASYQIKTVLFHFKNMDNLRHLFLQLPCIFDHALSTIVGNIPLLTTVSLQIYHDSIRRPILISHQPRSLINGTAIIAAIEYSTSSDEEVTFEQDMIWRVTICN